MDLTIFLEQALDRSDRAMTYMVSRRLAELYPGQAVLEYYGGFDVVEFVRYGQGEAKLADRIAQQRFGSWDPDEGRIDRELLTSWVEVQWQDSTFQVVQTMRQQCGMVHWIVGPEQGIEPFMAAVLAFTMGRSPRTHVYSGWWNESETIDKVIEQASWDDLVLPSEARDLLEMHTVGFFDAKDEFASLQVPWKRGVLLTGPPGNGKSHVIRAILNRLTVPRLIVKSFGDEPDDVQEVFDKVRELSPCVLILEDIDSLIRPALLSSVLNALDGTEPLEGVLVLATTNHPEKLDPAIRCRPSRFDRVIEFGPPELRERLRLLRKLLDRGPKAMRMSSAQLRRAAERCEGFSYAFLKELAISATVVWGLERAPGSMYGIVVKLIGELRSQFEATVEATPADG